MRLFRQYSCNLTKQFAVLIILILPVMNGTSAPAAQVFSQSSAWNVPIPSVAVYSASDAAPNLLGGLDTWMQNSWTIPYYTSTTTDPLRPLLYNSNAWSKVYSGEWLRSGNSQSVEKAILSSSNNTFPYTGNVYSSTSATEWILPASYNKTISPQPGPAQFHFNAGMKPATGSDGHMAVAQPNGGVLETYATIVLRTGQVVALSYSITSPTSLGDGWQNGQTASMLPVYAGSIQDTEISAGINHAIASTVPASILTTQISYPAYAFDRGALKNKPYYSGNIPMGGQLALPPSITIDSLGLSTPEGKAIATAAKKYGFIIVDKGGGGICLRVRPNGIFQYPALHAYNWPLQNDLNKIVAKLREVSFSTTP
jgi:hypothetical protein